MPEDEKEKEPYTLCIRKSELEIYNRLLAEDSPFSGMSRKRVFLLSMATGLNEGKYAEVKVDRETYVRNEYLTPEERAIIDAIAVHVSGSLEVLNDTKKVFGIAEGYASGGLKSLCEQVFEGEYGTYSKRLEAELRTIAKKALEGMGPEAKE
jgi:hypothetical protein